MRVLVTSVPGLGHLHPVLPLALAARKAGHDVRVATGPDLVGWVERCGVSAYAAGLPFAGLRAEVERRGLAGPDVPRHLFTSVAVPPMAKDLLTLVDDWRPDVVVHEEGEYAAPLVATMRDLPTATHSWPSPARIGPDRTLLDEPLGEVWNALGAAGPSRQAGVLYLDACPGLFQHADVQALAPRVLPVQPTAYDGPAEQPPDWLAQLPRPAVYVTLGTVTTFCVPERLQLLADASAQAAAAVVVATGPHPIDVVTPASDTVRVVRYLPQSLVLPHVDAVLSHGGAGTTLGALMHGLPQLVLPGPARSQQQSAMRVAAAGLGLRLGWADAHLERVRSSMHEVLTRIDVRREAAAARADLASRPDPDAVIALLQRELAPAA